MRLQILSLLLGIVLCDELYYYDYETGGEYNWEILRHSDDYIIKTDTDVIIFNIGKDIKETCQGQSASAIRFSKAKDSCEILGRNQLIYLIPYNEQGASGIAIFYEGGSICQNKIWTDFKRRVEFKLTCNYYETDFVLTNSLDDCTTIFEKSTSAGCPAVFQYNSGTRLLLLL